LVPRNLEGVNHCSLHCRLAKFRGLMIVVKLRRCDWPRNAFFLCAQLRFPGHGFFLANHSAVYDHVHQTTEFRQTTV